MMASPSSKAMPIASLGLRVLTFTFLSVSLILLTTNTRTVNLDPTMIQIHFREVKAYRYVHSTIVIGMAYILFQLPFAIYHVKLGKPFINHHTFLHFDFCGDKVISYLLATGTGAAFAVRKDLKEDINSFLDLLQQVEALMFPNARSKVDKFFDMGNISGGFLCLAFLCTAASSVISSFALQKKEYYIYHQHINTEPSTVSVPKKAENRQDTNAESRETA